MECFGGGIRHTLSRRCIEDEHDGAREHYEERDRHLPGCGKFCTSAWPCHCFSDAKASKSCE